MDVLASGMDAAYEHGPFSPGFSGLLADLVTESDDASCKMTEDPSFPHHQTAIPWQTLTERPVAAINLVSTNATNQSTGLQQPLPALVGAAQSGNYPPADLYLALGGMQWSSQANGASASAAPQARVAAGTSLPPAFTSGLTSQPTAGSAAAGAAGSRRGRKPLPRLPDLQQQVDTLTEQFQRLSQENTFLRGKLKLLECVVPYRDSHIGFLASVKNGQPQCAPMQHWQLGSAPAPAATAVPPPPNPAVASPAATLTATVSSDSSFAGSSWPSYAAAANVAASGSYPSAASAPGLPSSAPSSCEPGVLMAAAAATSSGDTAGACRQVDGCNPSRPLPPPPPPVGPSGGPAACGSWSTAPPAHLPGTPAVIALRPGPDGEVPPITAAVVEELRRVTPREFQLYYKDWVMQLSVMATAAEVHGPGSSQYERLERFLERSFHYMDQVMLLSPDCYVQSLCVNIETGQQERPSDGFWTVLGSSLRLTPEQLEHIRTLTVVHQTSVAPVARERLRLASELSASIAGAEVQQSSLSEVVDEVTERLRRNVIKEHQAQMDIGDFLCSSVLSPIQVARVIAASYPYIPDCVAIMHACVADRDDAPPSGPPGGGGGAATSWVPGGRGGSGGGNGAGSGP